MAESDRTPLIGQSAPMFAPPKRRFQITYQGSAHPQKEVIERDAWQVQSGFFIFANGGEYMVRENIVAINGDRVARVDELDLAPREG